MRPLTKGFIVGGISLLIFYLAVLSVAMIFSDNVVSFGGSGIGVIQIDGMISDSMGIIDQLIEYREDSSVKAIILRVNSPGGAVAPSQEIYKEVKRTVESYGKPVIASFGSTAASGGYYVAAPCTAIVANPGTLTGSIGVIMEFINVEEFLEKIGLEAKTVKSGPFKDTGNFTRKATPEELKRLQTVVDDVHMQFVQDIVDGRNLTLDEVKALADGSIMSGKQAKENKLVDELGNFEDAVMIAAELGRIKGTPDIRWPKKRKLSYLDIILDDFGSKIAEGLINRLTGQETNLYYR